MPNELSGWECRHCLMRFDKREAAEQHEKSHMTTITVYSNPRFPDPDSGGNLALPKILA